jgi:sensor domain CHASE-containing protein
VLREVESVAARPSATRSIRANYDAQWVEYSVGTWLQAFFGHDVVVVVDGADQVKYALFASPGDAGKTALNTELAADLDLLRGRRNAMPTGTIPIRNGNRSPGSTALLHATI